jgi:hypothetical protein
MELYAGINLHSSSKHIGIINERHRSVYHKKLAIHSPIVSRGGATTISIRRF